MKAGVPGVLPSCLHTTITSVASDLTGRLVRIHFVVDEPYLPRLVSAVGKGEFTSKRSSASLTDNGSVSVVATASGLRSEASSRCHAKASDHVENEAQFDQLKSVFCRDRILKRTPRNLSKRRQL